MVDWAMAQKNGAVTKTFLRSELGRFGKKLKTEIKDDLSQTLKVEISEAVKNDLYQIKDEIKNELKDDLYQIKDEIVGEFKKAMENEEVHQASHTRINDDLGELESRVERLEQPASSR